MWLVHCGVCCGCTVGCTTMVCVCLVVQQFFLCGWCMFGCTIMVCVVVVPLVVRRLCVTGGIACATGV